jgi:hypothetical protein
MEFNMKNNKELIFSWPVIVIAFIIFWPVGLGLLVMRMNSDKVLLLQSGRVLSLFSWLSGCLVLVGITANIDEGYDSFDIGLITFFLIATIVLNYFGRRLKRKGLKYKKYIDLVVNSGIMDIETLSNLMSKPYEEVYSDIEEMIEKGYFKRTYINDKHQIVIVSSKVNDVPLDSSSSNSDEREIRKVVVRCSACGANNEVGINKVSECEYCGSKIQG